MTTVTITDFLLARIADDEEGANHDLVGIDPSSYLGDREYMLWTFGSRTLAQCAALREVVELHSRRDGPTGPGDTCSGSGLSSTLRTDAGCDTLRALASAFADHPEYRAEWAL